MVSFQLMETFSLQAIISLSVAAFKPQISTLYPHLSFVHSRAAISGNLSILEDKEHSIIPLLHIQGVQLELCSLNKSHFSFYKKANLLVEQDTHYFFSSAYHANLIRSFHKSAVLKHSSKVTPFSIISLPKGAKNISFHIQSTYQDGTFLLLLFPSQKINEAFRKDLSEHHYALRHPFHIITFTYPSGVIHILCYICPKHPRLVPYPKVSINQGWIIEETKRQTINGKGNQVILQAGAVATLPSSNELTKFPMLRECDKFILKEKLCLPWFIRWQILEKKLNFTFKLYPQPSNIYTTDPHASQNPIVGRVKDRVIYLERTVALRATPVLIDQFSLIPVYCRTKLSMQCPSWTLIFSAFDKATWTFLHLSSFTMAVIVSMTTRTKTANVLSNYFSFLLYFAYEAIPNIDKRGAQFCVFFFLSFIPFVSYNYDSYMTTSMTEPLLLSGT